MLHEGGSEYMHIGESNFVVSPGSRTVMMRRTEDEPVLLREPGQASVHDNFTLVYELMNLKLAQDDGEQDSASVRPLSSRSCIPCGRMLPDTSHKSLSSSSLRSAHWLPSRSRTRKQLEQGLPGRPGESVNLLVHANADVTSSITPDGESELMSYGLCTPPSRSSGLKLLSGIEKKSRIECIVKASA
ncbi:hypothetical protein K466DRAFT_144261 [Polyporus arcularius HHB13444]|uniref:Uncharacterized protein n=1 Tax=Polyporus arcularius HHB13444 TaxID=1314778 RepID=A0A5C3PAA0_9APHY|nr:hypothetical protein K466DRAFT_144261 [Polyporus arcularius HHB13444]